MARCKVPDCDGCTEYDESAQAVLCTTCGTVATQVILTHEWEGELSGSSLYFGPTTLKSLRRVGGVLTGQSSKEDRDRKNTVAIHQYILGLLTKLASSGLAPRAQTLFDQARVRGKYRWGKKAVLAAGACAVVVLRQNRKGIMMSHIASVMDVSPHALCRIFTEIDSLLGLQVPPFDPVSLLPSLQSHLISIISSPTCPLAQVVLKMLEPLPPAPVLRLATSLATLLNRLDEFSSLGGSPLPTACALFILALEGQAATSFPSYTTLVQELSRQAGIRKDLVIGRYRDISKVIEEWLEDVPWLSGADHPDNRLGKKRKKASQRDVIAMALKDVVQFQEDIMKARNAREIKSPVTLSLEVADDDDKSSVQSNDGSMPALGQKRKRSETTEESSSSTKFLRVTRSRRAKPLSQLDLASLSLLSPFHPLASGVQTTKSPLAETPEVDALRTQILTSSTFPANSAPTRLQRLTAVRGGESAIDDAELFEEGELDGFVRSEDEVDKMRDLFGWDQVEPIADGPQQHAEDWDLADMAAWQDLGGDKDADEQVLGEWREASPSGSPVVGDGDRFDVSGEW